jgi:hypothetical protein
MFRDDASKASAARCNTTKPSSIEIIPRIRPHALPEEPEWTSYCLEWIPFKASLHNIQKTKVCSAFTLKKRMFSLSAPTNFKLKNPDCSNWPNVVKSQKKKPNQCLQLSLASLQ